MIVKEEYYISLELEKLKKLGLNTVDGSAPPPVAPPRQRHNPFNAGERESAFSGSQRRVVKKRTFADLHQEYGQSIVQARELWKKSQLGKSKHLTEDILITL